MSEKDAKKEKPARAPKGGEQQGGKGPKEGKQQPKQGKGTPEAKRAAEPVDEKPSGPAQPARLQVYYREQVAKDLTQQFGYKSPMQVPRIEKIVLNMGVKEQIIFPEIEYDKIDAIRGMNITISTTAKTDAEAKALLAAFKFPFRG